MVCDSFVDIVLRPFCEKLETNESSSSFVIAGKSFNYAELALRVNSIKHAITGFNVGVNQIFGLSLHDDLDTYASIFALWLEGKAYVPLHPSWPSERTDEIINQVGISYILDSKKAPVADYHCEFSAPVEVSDDEPAYILFTSGSTGKPKGVPVLRRNLAAFVSAFNDMSLSISADDRFLQCFDLTFDLSVFSYLIPLLKGASVYTVSYDSVRHFESLNLLMGQEITVALMTPSTIKLLRPYFGDIELPNLRYSLFCGEALPIDVTAEWAKCAPNAEIYNVYGPTEDTIFCTYYRYPGSAECKGYNGIMSIGRAMSSGDVKVLSDSGEELHNGESGELNLYGQQLFAGYWKNEQKTAEAIHTDSIGKICYKSGDLCFCDEDGDYMYLGRLDQQVKIQGYRIELGEIEHHAKQFLGNKDVACVVLERGAEECLAMAIESEPFDLSDLKDYLASRMPRYMMPSDFRFFSVFPLNGNGKTDRKAIKNLF